MYEQETSIAKQLAAILSAKRKKPFKKEIIVCEDCGGSLDVSHDRVLIHPFFLTEGNPIAVVEHILDVSEEFDAIRERRTIAAIADLKSKLRFCLRELSRLDPTSIQKIIEDELGLGEEDVLRLEPIEVNHE